MKTFQFQTIVQHVATFLLILVLTLVAAFILAPAIFNAVMAADSLYLSIPEPTCSLMTVHVNNKIIADIPCGQALTMTEKELKRLSIFTTLSSLFRTGGDGKDIRFFTRLYIPERFLIKEKPNEDD